MRKKSEVIVVGWVNYGHEAFNGEDMKNQLMIKKLSEMGVTCHVADFYKWKRHPWVFLKLVVLMFLKRRATLIFSTSAKNVYPMMRLMKALKWRQPTVHWVIGGSLGQNVKNGTFRAEVINYMDWTLVESNVMRDELERFDVTGVMQVPNFKPIDYYPDISKRKNSRLRFVFLSRIMREKGCDYIFEAAGRLNSWGMTELYEIDFYGRVADDYGNSFREQEAKLRNVSYKRFLNLRENSGYDQLAEYDAMLFPTYWRGEGFAGVFIDAFIAGLPLIASDWAHNTEFLEEGRTALFVPVHDAEALARRMAECIRGEHDLKAMSAQCQKESRKYNVDNVVTEELLTKIGILG